MKLTSIKPEGGTYSLTAMGEQPRPAQASLFMVTSRGRASAQESRGGFIGILYVLVVNGVGLVEIVRAERSMALRVALRAEKGERCL